MKQETPAVLLSVVIPVHNAEAALPKLFDRLYPVLDGLDIVYEAVFVDGGSQDRSATLLRQQHKLRGDVTRVLLFRGGSGRQAAIAAGFGASKGDRVLTLDSDLDSPPKAIPQVLAEMDGGHDYVGAIRPRRDSKWTGFASKSMSRLRERITGIQMTDPGCMLRGYDREILDAILASDDACSFISALGCSYAANPTEILLDGSVGAAGEPEFPLYELVELNLRLMTGFSLIPLRVFSLVGIGAALVSFLLFFFLAILSLFGGADIDGVFTLLALLFFLAGVVLFGIGLLGQYLSRLLERPCGRPGYPVREHLRPRSDSAAR